MPFQVTFKCNAPLRRRTAKYVARSLARWSAKAACESGSRALLAPAYNQAYFDLKSGDVALKVVIAAFVIANRFEAPHPDNADHRAALNKFMRCAIKEYQDGVDSATAAEALVAIRRSF